MTPNTLTGPELARLLRIEHTFAGLLFTVAEEHAKWSAEELARHGFSGHANSYLGA